MFHKLDKVKSGCAIAGFNCSNEINAGTMKDSKSKAINVVHKTDSPVLLYGVQGHSNRVIERRTISGRRLVSLSASRQTGRFPTISAPIDPDSIN